MSQSTPSVYPRIKRERRTISKMIALYCRKNHIFAEKLCIDCEDLMDYASERLAHCPFGENKPACSKCEVHCYQPKYREQIRAVMRFSGPRMLLHHPGFLISHTLDILRYPPILNKK